MNEALPICFLGLSSLCLVAGDPAFLHQLFQDWIQVCHKQRFHEIFWKFWNVSWKFDRAPTPLFRRDSYTF